MGEKLDLRNVDTVDNLRLVGGLTPDEMRNTWRALDRIRLIATNLPAYQSGSNPSKVLDRTRSDSVILRVGSSPRPL
jgi:hypothetical protein